MNQANGLPKLINPMAAPPASAVGPAAGIIFDRYQAAHISSQTRHLGPREFGDLVEMKSSTDPLASRHCRRKTTLLLGPGNTPAGSELHGGYVRWIAKPDCAIAGSNRKGHPLDDRRAKGSLPRSSKSIPYRPEWWVEPELRYYGNAEALGPVITTTPPIMSSSRAISATP